eukprot:3097490-Prymnesium_polylepis.1
MVERPGSLHAADVAQQVRLRRALRCVCLLGNHDHHVDRLRRYAPRVGVRAGDGDRGDACRVCRVGMGHCIVLLSPHVARAVEGGIPADHRSPQQLHRHKPPAVVNGDAAAG